MRIHLHDGTVFAEVEVSGIRGVRALGFHRLIFDLKLTVLPVAGRTPPRPPDLYGELSVTGKAGKNHVGRLHPLSHPGILQAERQGLRYSEPFEVEMDSRRLEAVEALRLGGDLTFQITLRGTVDHQSGAERFCNDLIHRVNQGTWIEVLDQLGYSRTMLLEVPLPDRNAPRELSDSVEHLNKAHQQMTHGNWREAVGCCRDALESLSVALGDDDSQDPRLNALFEGSRNWDKAQRLRAVRRALKVLTHPARHADVVAAQVEWDRIDAQTMITMIGAILQRCLLKG